MVYGMKILSRFCRVFFLIVAVTTAVRAVSAQSPDEQRILALANQARSEAGIAPVRWDAALAAAAHTHAQRMAQEGPISHRYDGEADLPERAAAAGARFSLIEENIAAGPNADQIHDGWMHSPGHHDNLLNPKIDRIGVAVVPAHGMLYAVADYTQGVSVLSKADVEAKVGAVVAQHGVALSSGSAVDGARRYCALEEGKSMPNLGLKAGFLMRWQSADIAKLPPELEKALASGQFKQAAVGACEAKGGSGGAAFSAYRAAVLLY